MGNAGDLLKHGLLAEFAQWWCINERRPLRFLDPFAGRPWGQPQPEVTKRIEALISCAISDAQPEPNGKYYGSSHVVLNAARAAGCEAEVYISDSDPDARASFIGHPSINPLRWQGFLPSDGFLILGTDIEADLVLLDPFADFLLTSAAGVIPRIATAAKRMACILFVLNLDPKNRVGQRYHRLRHMHLPQAWSLRCPKLLYRGIAGESRYDVEVLLAWDLLRDHPNRGDLHERLERYRRCLSRVLCAEVTFET